MCCDGRRWGCAHPGLGAGSRAREGAQLPLAPGEPCQGFTSPWGSQDMADTGSRSVGRPRRVCEWWGGAARDGTAKGGAPCWQRLPKGAGEMLMPGSSWRGLGAEQEATAYIAPRDITTDTRKNVCP